MSLGAYHSGCFNGNDVGLSHHEAFYLKVQHPATGKQQADISAGRHTPQQRCQEDRVEVATPGSVPTEMCGLCRRPVHGNTCQGAMPVQILPVVLVLLGIQHYHSNDLARQLSAVTPPCSRCTSLADAEVGGCKALTLYHKRCPDCQGAPGEGKQTAGQSVRADCKAIAPCKVLLTPGFPYPQTMI